jgi:hypothetical protein
MKTINTSIIIAVLISLPLIFSSCAKEEWSLQKSVSDQKLKNSTLTLIQQTEVDLMAGQHIYSGKLSIQADLSNFYVTFATENGWLLDEVHLYLGTSLQGLPVNKKGNPVIGQFPFKASSLGGVSSYQLVVPKNQISASDLCGLPLFYAAHAVVKKVSPDGSMQQETAWASGSPIVSQGSWAMYNSFPVVCSEPPVEELTCETAYGFGSLALNSSIPNTNRWGWIITLNEFGSFTTPIYAGAGQNDITKGTQVGTLTYNWDGNILTVSYALLPGYSLSETHVYASSEFPTSAAPGLYGNTHELPADSSSDTFTLSVTGSTIYIIAHAVVCSTDWP